jgi:hypothetical protein
MITPRLLEAEDIDFFLLAVRTASERLAARPRRVAED